MSLPTHIRHRTGITEPIHNSVIRSEKVCREKPVPHVPVVRVKVDAVALTRGPSGVLFGLGLDASCVEGKVALAVFVRVVDFVVDGGGWVVT